MKLLMNLHSNTFTVIRRFNLPHEYANRHIHTYRTTVPWTNVVNFSEELIKSVVYQDNNLLVLNKPYGVSFSRDASSSKINTEGLIDPEDAVFKKYIKNQPKTVHSAYRTSGVVNDSLNLVDCLPYLKKHFGLEKLHIARVPSKYASGIAILTTSKEYVEFVNKCHSHAPTGKDKYLAVVVGTPKILESTIKLGFKLKENPKLGKRVILLQKWSNNEYKRGAVRIGTFHHQTLSIGTENLTSLVEVCVDLRKYYAYRVFCADYLLSPVLGDNLFGSRVQTVMGIPVAIDALTESANAPQVLPDDIYKLLNLTSGDASLIPVHIHLSEMMLPRFFKNKATLLLRAPPPPHFEWTCSRLGLTTSAQGRLETSSAYL